MHDLFIAVLGFYNGGTSNTVVVSESNCDMINSLERVGISFAQGLATKAWMMYYAIGVTFLGPSDSAPMK